MGLELKNFVPAEEADAAEKIIAAELDVSAKAVQGEVAAHSKVWGSKKEADQVNLTDAAKSWAIRQMGHRVNCPACNSIALVNGEPIAEPHMKLGGDEILETQEFLPSIFECVACGLKILGLSKLSVVGLGERFKRTVSYEASEYYAKDIHFHEYEEDNNENF